MRRWAIATGIAAVALAAAGAAIANHVTQADPATVPTGFLRPAHNSIEEIPLAALARAVTPDGADVFIQHVRLGGTCRRAGTHTGAGTRRSVKGSLTYEDAKAHVCQQTTYNPGEGFVDRGFGHVHRAIAGPDGVDFYVGLRPTAGLRDARHSRHHGARTVRLTKEERWTRS